MIEKTKKRIIGFRVFFRIHLIQFLGGIVLFSWYIIPHTKEEPMNLENMIAKGYNLLTTWGIRIIGVLVVLFLAWIVAGWAGRAAMRRFEKSDFDQTLSRFFANMIRYAIIIATGIGVLGVFGVQTASFAAVIAAAGLAVGLAFQGTLSNFASGVMLLVFRPFKIGDVVNAAGQIGMVSEIDLFTTEFTSFDNRRIIVPNSSIFGSTIENITHHPTRRVDVAVGTEYSADIDATRKVLESIPAQVEKALTDPEPQIFCGELGASSVDWQLRIWAKTEDYWDVYQDTIKLTKKALEEASIGIPFPQMDVHFDEPNLKALGGR